MAVIVNLKEEIFLETLQFCAEAFDYFEIWLRYDHHIISGIKQFLQYREVRIVIRRGDVMRRGEHGSSLHQPIGFYPLCPYG